MINHSLFNNTYFFLFYQLQFKIYQKSRNPKQVIKEFEQMSFSNDQKVNIGIGIIVSLISGFFVVRKISKRKQIQSLQHLYDEGLSNNLNKKVQRILSDKGQVQGLPIAIEKVTAHFINGSPQITLRQKGKDSYFRMGCDPFYVVERGQGKAYKLCKVDVSDSLVSQKVVIPDLSIRNQPNAKNKILASATTLGIIGTVGLSTDFSAYKIEAKMIGVDLVEIKKYIQDENFYNNLAIIISGTGVLLGLWWLIKTLRKNQDKRIPFETSLLQNSKRK